MTLQEYLTQEDPIRGKLVYLNSEEITKGVNQRLTGFTPIWIEGLPGVEYSLHENTGNIYTTDPDGNPGRITVFRANHCIFIPR